MKSKLNSKLIALLSVIWAASSLSSAFAGTSPGYAQVNLVSDLASNAPVADANLVNPWGIVSAPGAIWVNDNGPGLITAFTPSGKPFNYSVQVPNYLGAPGGTPSGLVFNDTSGFVLTNGAKSAPSSFLISTEDGSIAAWNHSVTGTNAEIVVDNFISGAVYKGLAIARDTNGTPHVYAANFNAGTVDEFDANFHAVSSFTDTNVPDGYAPFGIRTIRGKLFVTFALQGPGGHDDLAGPGHGFVDIFDTDGTLLRRFATQGALNSPWGMAIAPENFGIFSHALLVGNFGDGKINAYDLLTGKWLGNLATTNGSDIVIEGLWGLAFDKDEIPGRECTFMAQRLYFTAGINDESDGLFGYIRAVPAGH